MRGHYLLTVYTYFFVSTIPKIVTEFSFGIGMVITEKYDQYRPKNTDSVYNSSIYAPDFLTSFVRA